MVELHASVYDGEEDNIPFANASIVTIDDELSGDLIVVPMVESGSSTTGTTALPPDTQEAPPVLDIAMQTRESSEGTNTSSIDQETLQEETLPEQNIPQAAAAGGAVMGMFLGGPFLSLVLGVGSHHYSKQDGAMGDCARALGEVAIVAKEKFQQVDDRHHLVDQGKQVASKTWDRMQQVDREHKIKEKVGYFVSHCYALTLDFIYRHNLIERATDKFKRFIHCLTETVREHERRLHDRAHHPPHPHPHHHHPHHLHHRHHSPHRHCPGQVPSRRAHIY